MRFLLIILAIMWPSMVFAAVEVDENFDDQTFSGFSVYNDTGGGYCTDGDCPYGLGRGDTGYAIEGNHALDSMDTIGVYNNFDENFETGIYIRYYVKYDDDYQWPAETDSMENLKMFKLAGPTGWDIEFIYKDSDNGGPSNLQLYWFGDDETTVGHGTGTGNTTLGQTLGVGVWHKIEIWIKYPDDLHVAVNDIDVYIDTAADFRSPASAYTETQQFISIRAGTNATDGLWLWDDLYIETTGVDPIGSGVTCSDYNGDQSSCESNDCNYCDGTCQSNACAGSGNYSAIHTGGLSEIFTGGTTKIFTQ